MIHYENEEIKVTKMEDAKSKIILTK